MTAIAERPKPGLQRHVEHLLREQRRQRAYAATVAAHSVVLFKADHPPELFRSSKPEMPDDEWKHVCERLNARPDAKVAKLLRVCQRLGAGGKSFVLPVSEAAKQSGMLRKDTAIVLTDLINVGLLECDRRPGQKRVFRYMFVSAKKEPARAATPTGSRTTVSRRSK